MIISQLSVFLENKPGRLSAALDALSENKIDISALSLADSEEFGVIRLIVNKPDVAKEVLNGIGVIVKTNKVIAITMDDVPGGAGSIVRTLASESINISYLYAFVGKETGKALMVIKTDDLEKSDEILTQNGFCKIEPADIYRI